MPDFKINIHNALVIGVFGLIWYLGYNSVISRHIEHEKMPEQPVSN